VEDVNYKVHHGVAVACRADIDKYNCHRHRASHAGDISDINDNADVNIAGHVGISAVLECLQNVTRHGTLTHFVLYCIV